MSNSRHQDSINALKQQAAMLINAGQFESARINCQQACEQAPDDPEAWFMLGAITGQLADWEEAEKCCRHATRLAPQHPMSRYNLAFALLQQNRPAEAIDELQQAVRLQPGFFNAQLELGNAYRLTGSHDRSIRHFNKAVEIDPQSALAHLNLAHAFRDTERLDEAVTHYERCIELEPDNTEAYCELAGVLIKLFKFDRVISLLEAVIPRMPGRPVLLFRLAVAYQEQGDSDIALGYYNKVLEIEPENVDARTGIASIQALQGNFNAAAESLDKLIADHPEHSAALITFANLAHHVDASERAFQLVTEKLADPTTTERTQSKLYFALANNAIRNNDPEQAFTYYQAANRLHHAKFDYASYSGMLNALISSYSESTLPDLPRSENHSDTPIFIVGMPRSGTSLTEHILASHPGVYGAGELRHINYIVSGLNKILKSNIPYPLCLDRLNTPLLNQLADRYLAEIAELSNNARYVTDKMPVNFMHLGFIDLLFPNAHVIHCQRDPLDTCLSCYFQSFSGEHPYAYSLSDLGKYYRLYRKLMEHWKKVLRIPVYELSYESLVQNQEQETRKLLAFCGIEWNDACLDFHNTRRTVSTASYDQVRKPMYTKSIGRWRQYEQHLGPLIDELNKPD
jgi:tetratricopeptide (TPR) repeat protein